MCLRQLVALVIALADWSSHLAANEPEVKSVISADDAAIRESVIRGLPFLEQAGVAWMNERGCLSCHHVPFMLWTHHTALRKGFAVDPVKLSAWEAWARKDSLAHRNAFKLSKAALDTIEASMMPDTVRQKLAPVVDQVAVDEPAFLKRLSDVLMADELVAYQPLLLKAGELPLYSADRSGGGLDVLGQLVLNRQDSVEDPPAKEFREGLLKMIQQMQSADGSWTPGIQFASMRRWTKPAADQTTAMWAALALAAYDAADGAASPHVAKTLAYVAQQPAQPQNHEWLATRLLFEHHLGTAETTARLREQLIAVQGLDGGWSWEKDGPGDPYTTGLTLYVLITIGTDRQSSTVAKACTYLLSTQQSDGSWLTASKNISNTTVPERLKARDEIYHYWGTAWAVLGLLTTLR